MRRVRDEAAPREEVAGSPHEARELERKEAADEERLDGEQDQHAGDNPRIDRNHGDRDDQPQKQKECLRDGARRLVDHHRWHALSVRHAGPQQPDFHRLPAH